MPVKPKTAFQIFVNDINVNPALYNCQNQGQNVSQLKQIYENLDTFSKLDYLSQASQREDEYKKQYEEWLDKYGDDAVRIEAGLKDRDIPNKMKLQRKKFVINVKEKTERNWQSFNQPIKKRHSEGLLKQKNQLSVSEIKQLEKLRISIMKQIKALQSKLVIVNERLNIKEEKQESPILDRSDQSQQHPNRKSTNSVKSQLSEQSKQFVKTKESDNSPRSMDQTKL